MIYKTIIIIFNYMTLGRCLSVSYILGRIGITPRTNDFSYITSTTKIPTFNKYNHLGLREMTTSDKGNEKTVFHKIVSGELPCKKVYEDDLMLAFHDIEPVAPNHVLLIPKNFDGLASLSDATERHEKVLGHMMVKAAQIAKDNNYGDFRLVVNSGVSAQQTVFYLHMHLLSGRRFNWPPG
ncbi:protein kinase C inhibitor [Theileria orientalis]|uniref:Protein kinase C inhibitor n=1 Tax=Theileria orientalis TaxID=68886 RepID=A0A976SK34_THEOR|nr:protein kinase C inhibitor [Theileria orientalis]